ncbi:hypothetical protein [Streptomyces microflavus]|uniref:hypothetical protein n=1 Tax=Streptomyces microflavus TaxID=1919 RepID=UPI002E332608|nr:hypothetical protein [Streptomyces microflavus]
MTAFPNFLDHFAANLLELPAETENPHHRALLETYIEVQQLERRLLEAITGPHSGDGPEGFHACTEILVDRLAAGQELAVLLSAPCCCAAKEESFAAQDSAHCSPDCCEAVEGTGDEDAAGWHGCRRK